ncbi:RNA-directed DNA polymerase, eukaryota [Tanacetum coccineum]
MGDRRSFNSKEDLTQKISTSVFVTNFPDHCTAHDFWNVCLAYGKVVDVYIPFKKSKAGKKFAFVRFLKVDNLERLIGNLCTLWIGRFCLQANPVRFQREFRAPNSLPKKGELRGGYQVIRFYLSCVAFEKIKDINALSNLYVILNNEGFDNVKLSYLGGFWVLIDTGSIASKEKLIKHVGVLSWFSEIGPANNSFVSDVRLVWISIEGLPICAWNKNALAKIVSSWGTLSDVDATDDATLPFKKLCVVAKAKSVGGEKNAFIPDQDLDHVSKSSCMKENNEFEFNGNAHTQGVQSEDPFEIYDLLNKKETKEATKGDDPTYPPGFTPNDVVDKDGECIILGDFNEVRSEQERFGTIVNDSGAKAFNHFISTAGLIDLPLEGYTYTWAIKSASKMSKLDRFLVSEGLLSVYPSLSALSLDRHLSDHRPIIMREAMVNYGPSLFRVYHSWFTKDGFDKLVDDSWKNSNFVESSKITLLRKKFQALKASIKAWCKEEMQRSNEYIFSIQSWISDLDKMFDNEISNKDLVIERTSLLKDLHNINMRHSLDMAPKVKIRWSIEGDENSKFFHGIINMKRSQLAIRDVLVEGDWIDEPYKVKNEFLNHFSNCFSRPSCPNINLDINMFKQLSFEQNADLECDVSYDEIKRAVWDCGTNKSPGPDGFTFDFIRSNSSFITLIPKKQDAKLVKDFCPISLIGSFYKIIAKILANRLSMVISDLISDVQSAFVSNRQILDGPFILNELLSWCKYHKTKAMIFKVDFEKAFDSVRWDYLDGILSNFGFGAKWRGWIQGCLTSAMGSILVNGSPTSEFKFHKGLKQGDPLSPFLFILVMESLHLSFNNILNAGLFKGIHIDESLTLSHLFYADDAVFIVKATANIIGCSTFSSPFNYLGVKVGMSSSRRKSWDEVLDKISSRLSKWKIKTLSIGGRLTLIKSVLTSLPLYHMSIHKAPMGVLHTKKKEVYSKQTNGIDMELYPKMDLTPHPNDTNPDPPPLILLPVPANQRGETLILNSVKMKTNFRWTDTQAEIIQIRTLSCYWENESIHDYFVRFHKLVNDMKITQLNIPTHQMNTKFVNNLPAYWGNFHPPTTKLRLPPTQDSATGAYVPHCYLTNSVASSSTIKDKALAAWKLKKGDVFDAEAAAFLRYSGNVHPPYDQPQGTDYNKHVSKPINEDAYDSDWMKAPMLLSISCQFVIHYATNRDASGRNIIMTPMLRLRIDDKRSLSMIAILTDLQTQQDGQLRYPKGSNLDLENKVRQEQALVIQRNKRNAELVQENDLLKSTLSGKEKSIAFLQSEKEKILSEKKDLADSYLDWKSFD